MRPRPIYDGDKTLYPPDPDEAPSGWVIAQHQVWIPGIYENEQAARAAFDFCDCILNRLQKAANEAGTHVITIEDLRTAAPCEVAFHVRPAVVETGDNG